MYSKILLVGPLPPPMGGISVYVCRLADKLGDRCNVFDTTAPFFKNLGLFMKINRNTVVHYNSSNWIAALPFLWYTKLRGGRFVRNTHGFWQVAERLSGLKKMLTSWVVWGSDAIICVSERDRESVLSLGAKQERTCVIPAFIPPSQSEMEESGSAVPEWVWDQARETDCLIVANGRLVIDSDGNDLYGLDMCVRLAGFMGQALPEKNVKLLFFLSEYGEKEKRYLEGFDPLPKEFAVVPGNVPLCAVLPKAHCFIRPTTRDGDSVSVREALSFGIPCVCSDAAQRPDGALMFGSQNQESLNSSILEAISNGENTIETTDFSDEILRVLINGSE